MELARDIAGAFNRYYDQEFFPLPEPRIFGTATRVMSLRDGTSKMSKSDPSDFSRITFTDDGDAIADKIRRAKTDPEPLPSEAAGLENRPEADNLVGIYAALSGESVEQVLGTFGGKGFADFKKSLSDVAVSVLSPITGEMQRLLNDPAEIDAVLASGTERANAIAAPVLAEAKDIVGFLKP